jgi:hypothetical protein
MEKLADTEYSIHELVFSGSWGNPSPLFAT